MKIPTIRELPISYEKEFFTGSVLIKNEGNDNKIYLTPEDKGTELILSYNPSCYSILEITPIDIKDFSEKRRIKRESYILPAEGGSFIILLTNPSNKVVYSMHNGCYVEIPRRQIPSELLEKIENGDNLTLDDLNLINRRR